MSLTLHYMGLAIGLSIAAVFLRLAWDLWRNA
jgi:hypothetical protein